MAGLQKTGEKAKSSGEYLEVGKRGGKVSNARKYSMNKGVTLPPVKSGHKLKRVSRKKK